MDDFDGDELNQRAFYAIRYGFSRNVAWDLIALLRSGADIAPEVRDAMAIALEAGIVGGKGDGIQLTVSGNQHGSRGATSSDVERDALDVIELIEATLESNTDLSPTAACKLVAAKLGKGVGTCQEFWGTLRPIYRECLADLERGIMGASLDQAEREHVAMSFAYKQLQQIRRDRRPVRKGIRSA